MLNTFFIVLFKSKLTTLDDLELHLRTLLH